MSISEDQQQIIQDWLIKAERTCPGCRAEAEKLLPVEVYNGLPPGIGTEHGINTSAFVHHAKIVCQNKDCGFEWIFQDLESYGLY